MCRDANKVHAPFYETIARFNMTWICNADYAVKHILFVV